MATRPPISDGSNADPFEVPIPVGNATEPTSITRVIGACCGAFVFCFTAILLSLPMLLRIGQAAAGVFWIVSLVLGAVGGAMFPRLGHFLAYAFLIFMNICLSLTIGRNPQEQALLFGIFTFVESIFFMSHLVIKASRASD